MADLQEGKHRLYPALRPRALWPQQSEGDQEDGFGGRRRVQCPSSQVWHVCPHYHLLNTKVPWMFLGTFSLACWLTILQTSLIIRWSDLNHKWKVIILFQTRVLLKPRVRQIKKFFFESDELSKFWWYFHSGRRIRISLLSLFAHNKSDWFGQFCFQFQKTHITCSHLFAITLQEFLFLSNWSKDKLKAL